MDGGENLTKRITRSSIKTNNKNLNIGRVVKPAKDNKTNKNKF